jgi:NADH-quinone oxidoreductase subunit A
MDSDVEAFFPILILLAAILAFVVLSIAVTHWIAPRRRTPVKEMPYESGMDPIGDARQHFDVKYYLVAILFLVFDVELLFLYPWAVAAYREAGLPGPLRLPVYLVMLVFLATLAIAFVYAWRKGVFKWR